MLQTNVSKEEAKHMDITLIRYGSNIETSRNWVTQYYIYSDLIIKCLLW